MTFPIQCLITRNIIKGATYKTVLFKGKFRTETGNHLVRRLTPEIERYYYKWVPVDHFKFTKYALDKLRYHTKIDDAFWPVESERFLNFIKQSNNTINVNYPELHCNNFTPFDETANITSRHNIIIRK